jgi:hypothetical protein
MAVKKPSTVLPKVRMHSARLKRLYAHRTAIDVLIQRLEEYARFRTVRLDERRRRAA